MAEMRSSVPAFKAALLARLIAASGLTDVGISWGNTYPDRASEEMVFIGSATVEPWQQRAAGSQANEEYRLALLISIVGSSLTPQADLETRAYAIAEEVIDSVMAWRTTGYGGYAVSVLPGAFEDDESLDGEVREASITLTLDVKARI